MALWMEREREEKRKKALEGPGEEVGVGEVGKGGERFEERVKGLSFFFF